MSALNELRLALAEYDGRHTESLEAIRDAGPPTAGTLRAAIDLGADPDQRLAAAATWLLRAWAEAEVRLAPSQVARLARTLPSISGAWARLHVCQTVRSIRVPVAEAEAFADFLEACRVERQPFLRAWAVDGLHRLALQHPRFEPRARVALEEASEDPAASVRARVRRIQRGE